MVSTMKKSIQNSKRIGAFALALVMALTLLPPIKTLAASGDMNYGYAEIPIVNNPPGGLSKNLSGNAYEYSPNALKADFKETKKNTYTTTKGTKYTFTTKYFLPLDHKNQSGQFANPQSMVALGNYLYVVYEYENASNKGCIVRYSKDIPIKSMDDLRWMNYYVYKNPNNNKEKAAYYRQFLSYIKIGPDINIGHGQGFSTDGKNLFLLGDTVADRNLVQGESVVLQRISVNSLKPDKTWKFKMHNARVGYNATYSYNPHVLAFTDKNTFYTAISLTGTPGQSIAGANYFLWKGTISGDSVKVEPAFRVKNSVGKVLQSLSFNSHTNRLYIISDAAVTG